MVEGAVVKTGQALLQVALDHVDAVADRRQDLGVFEFDAVAPGAALLDQAPEQGTIAATEVEHALARLHPAGDQVEIGSFRGGAHNSIRFR
jgi:hypothetical protein